MNALLQPTEIELLTFRVFDQEYALDIMSVREIRGWTETTPLPHAPAYLKGVINLRGAVLPVMDLGVRVGLQPRNQTGRNVIIVVKHDAVMIGLLVDSVSDIITLTADHLQQPPKIGAGISSTVVKSLTIFNDQMIRVLDLGATVLVDGKVAA
jgi:purine-binding chemotaxis protein CheW